MKPKFEWQGSPDLDVKKGIATFSLGEKSVTVELDAFRDAGELHALMRDVYVRARADAIMDAAVRVALLFRDLP